MIAATRREALFGAVAVPALGTLPQWQPRAARVLLHDPALVAGRRLALSYPGEALAIEGDRVRLARAVFARRPSLVLGISRPADALLIEDIGAEAGYRAVEDGDARLRGLLAGSAAGDKGLVLAWMLAPRP